MINLVFNLSEMLLRERIDKLKAEEAKIRRARQDLEIRLLHIIAERNIPNRKVKPIPIE